LIVKFKACPVSTVADVALVKTGARPMVSTNDCELLPALFVAVNVIGYVPADPAGAVPASVAVPFAAGVNVTPLGSAPEAVMLGAGVPDAVTLKVNAVASRTVRLLGLVMTGTSCTLNVTG
jgi:hypothetical protein